MAAFVVAAHAISDEAGVKVSTVRWMRSITAAFIVTVGATPVAHSQNAATTRDSVWVNSSSRVYHCPGTRYFGATSRGRFMSENAAVAGGFRPAYGRGCGSANATRSKAPEPRTSSAPSPMGVRVWVNNSTRVYHCPGTRYYGSTKSGRYMQEGDAIAAGNRAAGGRRCS